jgi:hypothetical protein
MPKYDVEFDDGRVVTVDAPMGASSYALTQLAYDKLTASMAPPEPPAPAFAPT